MDTALSRSGDFFLNARQEMEPLTGREEQRQRLYLLLSARRGGFLYDKCFGSSIFQVDLQQSDALLQIEARAREALDCLPDAEVTGVSAEPDGIHVFVLKDNVNYDIGIRREEG